MVITDATPLFAEQNEIKEPQQPLQEDIPLIDLAPFFEDESVEGVLNKRERLIKEISEACQEWGFFQVINHGLNPALIERSLKMQKEFFARPFEEKMTVVPAPETTPVPTGYCHESGLVEVLEKKEHLFFFADDKSNSSTADGYSRFNCWPEKPEDFRAVIKDQLIVEAQKTAAFLLSLISRSLGLPANYLYERYQDKLNALILLCYPPSPKTDTLGLAKHQDGNVLNVVAQTGVEGLQVLRHGEWVTIKPIKDALVVNVGDIIQVWSNNKYRSVMHRVINNKTETRYSFSFSCVPGPKNKVSPLPQFTTDINESPRYRPFEYGEYMRYRFENKQRASKNVEEITIEHYSIA